MKLVTPGVFFDCWEQQKPLPKCQDVLPQFVVDINELTDEEPRTLEVLAISHCWVDKAHPDPLMYHLETLYHMLKKFIAGTYDKVRFYNSNGVKFVANGNEVHCGGDGRPVGIFLDWLSVPQETRSVRDKEVFKRALGNINLWYAHHLTTTWMLTSLPPDVTRAGYDASGWTTVEQHAASMISPSTQVLRIDMNVREKLSRGSFQCDYHQICWDTLVRGHAAAVEPGAFTRDVTAKHFTNGADCYEVVVPRYKATFVAVMSEATSVDHRGQSVSGGAL